MRLPRHSRMLGGCPGTRRTKFERSKVLAKVLKQAGFTRKGADWLLQRGDL